MSRGWPSAHCCSSQLRPTSGTPQAQVGGELGGELAAGPGDRAGRRDLLQDAGGVSCGDLLGGPARDQAAQHRVQAAGDLVPGPGR